MDQVVPQSNGLVLYNIGKSEQQNQKSDRGTDNLSTEALDIAAYAKRAHATTATPYHATCYCTCSDVMHASHGTCTQASQPPYENVARQKLLMDTPFMPSKLYLIKLTTSNFSTVNMRIAKQNMMKMILIPMHNENKADNNENFRICAEESVGPLYKW